MTKPLKIIFGLVSIILLVIATAIINFHLKTQSAAYVDELGETRLKGYPTARFLGGKAFGWFIMQEPTQDAVIITVLSESGNVQGRYELKVPESKRDDFTTTDIVFFNNEVFTLSDGSTLNGILLAE
ncbi:hypothetical protein [Vibrio neptunius]|uniref:Uncharacterized protein n=1 Tax=Vibrio neptunius TaxID=170651 RepID=A0ABS2ZWP2_9VIBR|nr:hypothetical protein [Vibrio neptunius]MBN3492231.1 hypothetical protein [Vibrio neptunius]MBN3514728.1 hypothetical protein [Vibrio neptunius]MBN3552117.1 hypothetical protein [Vibrio neptunius]MBN3576671.1 hypothetical protein [Vibrio neptunius]MCH9870335.1 hypothetical protein [Vibrio neptunius]